jgi:hypothetical protein
LIPIDFYIGTSYLDIVTQDKAPEAEHDGYLEKALSYFQAGYDVDITSGKHNTKDAKTSYLLCIGHTRALRGDFGGDFDEAIAVYRELADAKDIDYDKSGVTARIQQLEGKKRTIAAYNALAAKGMYYVSASGSDDNDGLSEAAACLCTLVPHSSLTAGPSRTTRGTETGPASSPGERLR